MQVQHTTPQVMPEVGIISIHQFMTDANVRVILKSDSTVWFVAADVCSALGLDNVTMALRRLDDDEKALNSIEGLSRMSGGNEQVNIISESGLYSLVLTSRKDEAKRFKKWVTAEVLPAIRQQGFYLAGGALTRERVQLVKIARQLTMDVARSKDLYARTMLTGLLGEVAQALGQPLPNQALLPKLPDQPALPGV
ncbi:hypothetical protein IGB42_02643 [Andreprevotia sp. IGB-42]|uniref:BRO-N domain-containing protein n=1 Tax=Andreprevotia sp. IGB-42 TaxID=2497473 RepID=UPI00157F4C82|nr:BRO family protein [Andreprevotia sp. IGB-42]KAF0812800.1 hypothetical protein IGB42_02643 [Andreprevotia sp. IGB-42]